MNNKVVLLITISTYYQYILFAGTTHVQDKVHVHVHVTSSNAEEACCTCSVHMLCSYFWVLLVIVLLGSDPVVD